MEDWVAIEVRTEAGHSAYFVTWGRIQDPVDPKPLEELALKAAGSGFSLGSRPVSARVCFSLQEAAGQPYFYEALLDFARRPIPDDGYHEWREAMRASMANGHEFYFLGRGWTDEE